MLRLGKQPKTAPRHNLIFKLSFLFILKHTKAVRRKELRASHYLERKMLWSFQWLFTVSRLKLFIKHLDVHLDQLDWKEKTNAFIRRTKSKLFSLRNSHLLTSAQSTFSQGVSARVLSLYFAGEAANPLRRKTLGSMRRSRGLLELLVLPPTHERSQ